MPVCKLYVISFYLLAHRDLLLIFTRDLSQFCHGEVNKVHHAIGDCLEYACLSVKQVFNMHGNMVSHTHMLYATSVNAHLHVRKRKVVVGEECMYIWY